jgi:hypothetical protein
LHVETRGTAYATSSSPPPSGAAGVKPWLTDSTYTYRVLGSALPRSRHPLTTITGARRTSGQTHSRAPSHPATSTSVPTAPRPNPFHQRSHGNSFDPKSASAITVGGTIRPSVVAVLRLMANSNLVGACAGSSAGLAPLNMRSTCEARAGRCPTYPACTSQRSIRSTKAEVR